MAVVAKFEARRKRRREKRKKRKEEVNDLLDQSSDTQDQAVDAARNATEQLPTYDALTGGMPQNSQLQQGQYANAFNQALGYNQNVMNQGFTPQDQAALGAAQHQAALGEQSQRQALFQQAQARGMGQGGAMMAGGLAAQQGAANRGADVAAQLGMAGRDRAFAASQNVANMGQGQGQALDAFNQWATGVRGGAAQQGFENASNAWGNYAGALQDRAQGYGQQAGFKYQQMQDRRNAFGNALMGAGNTIAQFYGASRSGGGGGGGS